MDIALALAHNETVPNIDPSFQFMKMIVLTNHIGMGKTRLGEEFLSKLNEYIQTFDFSEHGNCIHYATKRLAQRKLLKVDCKEINYKNESMTEHEIQLAMIEAILKQYEFVKGTDQEQPTLHTSKSPCKLKNWQHS